MDSVKLQQKVYSGYAKAAKRIGPVYSLYRPTSALNPLASSNLLGSLNASFNAEDMTYSRPNKYGKPTWFCLVDGTVTQVGDYLVGTQTFFIAAMQQTLPILAVECNRTINVNRPAQQVGAGVVGYGGNTAASETRLMTAWPASVLQGTKGEKNEVNLPGDVRNPWWIVLLPAFSGVTLHTADVITDELSRRYIISSAELTDLGWRCTAMQALT